ncbi:MAG: Ldh family oxidoreductase [Betaproteobacteria bacterium]|nr:Ldh family oxidoreductase [Betaproteobacteria bacterium]
MQLAIEEATDLAIRALTRNGVPQKYARMTAEHLVDAALCGHEFSSLPRLLAIVEELRHKPPAGEIRVVRESANSALIDGGDNIGYAVSLVAVDKATELCEKSGVAIVAANNTWFSGRLAYYVERAARRGFVALHTTNTTARVAPFGGIDRLMGTNPFAIAFPGEDDPLVIDIGTSATTWGEVDLSKTKGEALPEGVAVDRNGRPTIDPDAALEGAFLAWGGHRGSALSLAVQLLGVLAGSDVVIKDTGNYGLFFLVVDPELLIPGKQFRARVSELKKVIASTRPAAGVAGVRVPGESSQQRRKRALAAGVIQVDDKVYSRILELSAR